MFANNIFRRLAEMHTPNPVVNVCLQVTCVEELASGVLSAASVPRTAMSLLSAHSAMDGVLASVAAASVSRSLLWSRGCWSLKHGVQLQSCEHRCVLWLLCNDKRRSQLRGLA